MSIDLLQTQNDNKHETEQQQQPKTILFLSPFITLTTEHIVIALQSYRTVSSSRVTTTLLPLIFQSMNTWHSYQCYLSLLAQSRHEILRKQGYLAFRHHIAVTWDDFSQFILLEKIMKDCPHAHIKGNFYHIKFMSSPT
jgi:hypothetical protein